jgi:biopolymer transport protein ExbB
MMKALALALAALVLQAAESFGAESAPDDIAARLAKGADLTLVEMLRAGGAFTPLMIALSVAVTALVVYCAIEGRRKRMVSPAAHAEALARLASRDRAGATSALEGATSLYARAAQVALSQPPDCPPEEARARAKALGERDASSLRTHVSYVLYVGALAALVGMLGTVAGMLQAYGVLARDEFHSSLVYVAMFRSLVTSLFGAAIATAAFVAGFLLRGRLERSLADAAYAIEEIIARVQHGAAAPVAGASTVDGKSL